ncbi:hypothetical protein CcarbDRAFT_4057 [Clostridium carboxidivorans P7]|uniref:Methyl-accepting chemotaxis sensory transducer n=1 Tax=Clostridium carboxidivorans P7 TaxID=536227 RepID=C6PZ40_9CLOT|nr:hypothetical protein [Clostridium carboxidivorans]EET85482.1 hypothetical protein CcarbDRAFT_4057 [Clostridium carboxidivorans P7]
MFKKLLKNTEEKKSEYLSNAEYIHKDVLIKLFSDVIQGKPRKLTLDDVKCSDVVDKWNEVIDVLCSSRRKSVLEVNDLLQKVTRMDSVRDIIKSVDTQTEALHSMSANSEELAASIEEVSNMSQKMSQYSSDTKQVSEAGVSSVSESIEFVKKSFEDIEIINNKMQMVKEKTT